MAHDTPSASVTSTEINRATDHDRTYIISLARKFALQVGYLPPAAYDYHLERGNILLARENGDPCGFLVPWPTMKLDPRLTSIVQAAIQFDAQRRHHGLGLVSQLCRESKASGRSIVQARCREGLEANEFWRLAGFTEVAKVTGGVKRKKSIIIWRKPLHPMTDEELRCIVRDPRRPQGPGGAFISPQAKPAGQLELEFPPPAERFAML